MLSRLRRNARTEVGIYKAAWSSICLTEIKWNLGTHHQSSSNLTFSYTSGSNRGINTEQLTEVMTLGGRLPILNAVFHYCFSPLFSQFVKQSPAILWDVNNTQHRQRSMLLSIKSAESSDNVSGNTVYKKLYLLSILPLVRVFFILGHWACLSGSKYGSKISVISLLFQHPKLRWRNAGVCNDSFYISFSCILLSVTSKLWLVEACFVTDYFTVLSLYFLQCMRNVSGQFTSDNPGMWVQLSLEALLLYYKWSGQFLQAQNVLVYWNSTTTVWDFSTFAGCKAFHIFPTYCRKKKRYLSLLGMSSFQWLSNYLNNSFIHENKNKVINCFSTKYYLLSGKNKNRLYPGKKKTKKPKCWNTVSST